jgi:hypothetical protein
MDSIQNLNTKAKPSIKIFAGFVQSIPLKHALQKSQPWKISRIALTSDDLLEVRENGITYIGLYLKEDKVRFKSLQQTEERLKKMLQNYLQDIQTHDLHLQIFPTIFVT